MKPDMEDIDGEVQDNSSCDNNYPCELLRMIHEPYHSVDWDSISERVRRHPDEALVVDKKQMNALHAACYKYASPSALRAIIEAAPASAQHARSTGELPLHAAIYTTTEDIQHLILEAYPEATAVQDVYGDSPLHYAVRHGASFSLIKRIVEECPSAIAFKNMHGATPFSEMCHTYFRAENFQDIVNDKAGFYRQDWDLLTLFLRTFYSPGPQIYELITSDKEEPQRPQQASSETDTSMRMGHNEPLDLSSGDWMVHAAASTSTCPLDVLEYLCRLFPDQSRKRDARGMTPLLLASQANITNQNSDDASSNEGQMSVEQDDQETPPSSEDQYESGRSESSGGIYIPKQRSAVTILLQWDRLAAQLPDLQGRYPLAHAIYTGKPRGIIIPLLAANPAVIHHCASFDGRLYPMFVLAALYSPNLDTIYSISRMDPHLQEAARYIAEGLQDRVLTFPRTISRPQLGRSTLILLVGMELASLSCFGR